jgi:hypothetical protein
MQKEEEILKLLRQMLAMLKDVKEDLHYLASGRAGGS